MVLPKGLFWKSDRYIWAQWVSYLLMFEKHQRNAEIAPSESSTHAHTSTPCLPAILVHCGLWAIPVHIRCYCFPWISDNPPSPTQNSELQPFWGLIPWASFRYVVIVVFMSLITKSVQKCAVLLCFNQFLKCHNKFFKCFTFSHVFSLKTCGFIMWFGIAEWFLKYVLGPLGGSVG